MRLHIAKQGQIVDWHDEDYCTGHDRIYHAVDCDVDQRWAMIMSLLDQGYSIYND